VLEFDEVVLVVYFEASFFAAKAIQESFLGVLLGSEVSILGVRVLRVVCDDV